MSLRFFGRCSWTPWLRLQKGSSKIGQALNDLISGALVCAGIPVTKEPHGLSRSVPGSTDSESDCRLFNQLIS